MTAFLVATLLALVIAGSLTVVWREHREQFRRALAVAAGVVVLVSSYAWWVTHGYEIAGDQSVITLSELKLTEVAGSRRVTGIVSNLSRDQVVSAVPLVLQADDCRGDQCERLVEVERTLVISVPPGEQRPFVAVFNTPQLVAQGDLVFHVVHEGPRTHQTTPR